MSSSHGKKTVVLASKKRKGAASSSGVGRYIDWATLEHIQLANVVRALLTTDPWGLFFEIVELTYLKFTMELCSTFHLQTVMTNFDDPGTVQLCIGDLVRQLSVPEFRITLGLYMEEFMDDNGATQERGHLYRALCDSTGSALRALQHSSPIILPHSHRPDIPIGHLEHAKYEDDRETTWHLPSSILPCPTEEEDLEDITDDVPPCHEDPPSQPPPPSRPVHTAASYANISERLTRFKQQCFQRFDNIDATLQQICQHFHISSPPSPRKPSNDEDV
ncbi:hypothetical protein PVK06_011837 [Gossypium arboreum]|uniref:Uncharacterized protein n=1 Tax=Gossypium arboreum TaxID=29729 RepID=A0ABR0QAQ8_GOSAR|nr:hypothetical protein PVK06_011837 [Gossypium arboreum]